MNITELYPIKKTLNIGSYVIQFYKLANVPVKFEINTKANDQIHLKVFLFDHRNLTWNTYLDLDEIVNNNINNIKRTILESIEETLTCGI